MFKKFLYITGLTCVILVFISSSELKKQGIISYVTINPAKQNIKLYYKNAKGEKYRTFSALKSELESSNKKLVFAMNGGMYQPDGKPVGLYIENGITIKGINTRDCNGNFCLKPNGVFLLNKNKTAQVVQSDSFKTNSNIEFATQSGPMLLIDGKKHPAFNQGSSNLNIRNGVGVNDNGEVILAISNKRINFWDFAQFFEDKGCKNALYLDGFVSGYYHVDDPKSGSIREYGVLIGLTE